MVILAFTTSGRPAMRLATLNNYGLLQVTGDEARPFLHGQFTNDIENLAPGQARFAGWCTAKGRLLATFLVIARKDGFLLQLSRDITPAIAKRLTMFVLRSKVKVADVSADWVQAGAWDAASLSVLGVTPSPAAFGVVEAGGTLAVTVGPGRWLVLAQGDAARRLVADAPESEWTRAEIHAGRALISQPVQDQFVPQMVNLELAGGVDFRKGCYPGQEIVARAQYRGAVKRRMYRLRGATDLVAGQGLLGGDEPGEGGGMVVMAAGDEALAVLPVAAVEAKAEIRATSGAGALEVLSLPYSA